MDRVLAKLREICLPTARDLRAVGIRQKEEGRERERERERERAVGAGGVCPRVCLLEIERERECCAVGEGRPILWRQSRRDNEK